MTSANPFLGARPYGPAEAALFFGRSAATAALVERIALRPLTIVTAPSGIGKTSLLRAAVLPELERNGLCVVYMRQDPIDGGDAAEPLLGNRLATIMADALLPDPWAERECLRRVQNNGTLSTLSSARDWFKTLTPRDRIRDSLLAPPNGLTDRLPMLARCLRGTFATQALDAQFARLGSTPQQAVSLDTPLAELDELLGSAACIAGAGAARNAVTGGADDASGAIAAVRMLALGDGAEALLVRPDGDADCMVRILLVIDQFEQLFTLAAPRRRDLALVRLGALLDASLPLSVVLCLRKEWYADLLQHLPQLRRQTDIADRATFHLPPMTRAEADEVMVEAPRRLGAPPIAPDQRRELWDGLQQDDAIDTVALSIACHELVAIEDATGSTAAPSGVETLLTAYLHRAIGGIPARDRDEALEMLGEIAGSGATRSFVTHDRLTNAPIRDADRRARVLSDLQRAFLVKGDSPRRGYDKVYDVMHERLLEPLRSYVAERPQIAAFREATERLLQADENGLEWHHCCVLLRGLTRLKLDPRSAAILLLSLIQGLTRDRMDDAAAHRGPLAELLAGEGGPRRKLDSVLADLARAACAPALVDMATRRRQSWWLTPDEIQSQLDAPPDVETDAFAMASALRAPAGALRSIVRQLADRIAVSTPSRQPATPSAAEART